MKLLELPNLERVDSPNGRKYITPDGNAYPSVTTVLGNTLDHSGLDKWKEAVGEEEALKVSRTATRRGSNIHDLCENYVLGNPIDYKNIMPINKQMFLQLKGVIDKRISDIISVEGRLYSDNLKIAGSVDLIGNFDGKRSIIDYKTSRKNKEKEWIESYFLQTAIYSYCLWERTGLLHNQLVIVICVESENNPQIFVEKASNWIEKAKGLCEEYHEKFF